MSHSRSTSKDKVGNDDKNKSQEDDNISKTMVEIIFQRSFYTRRIVSVLF